MSRGMFSQKAFDAALPVAQARGQVILLQHHPGAPYDFLIISAAGIIAVCTRRSRRLHGSLAEIAERHRNTIALIGVAEFSPGFIREFWLWSPYGTMRFFRVDGPVITELDRLGVPVMPPVTGTVAMKERTRAKGPVKMTDGAKPGETKTLPGADAVAKCPDITSPDPAPTPKSEREPAPVRYLKRRARERSNQKEQPAAPVVDVPDSGVPGAAPPATGEEAPPS